MKQILLACFFLAFINIISAQDICGWKVLTEKNYSLSKEKNLSKKNLSAQESKTDDGATHTLPVVVHVITTGDSIGSADNPTDNMITSMITNLNNHFRKKLSADGGADMQIQFKLAIRSPQCNATTGIIRVNGSSIPNYVTGGITNVNTPGCADEKLVKALSDWPNTDYINIWIVNKINGNANAPGGYTYFPELNTAALDGLTLNASVVNGSNKKPLFMKWGIFFISIILSTMMQTLQPAPATTIAPMKAIKYAIPK